MNIEQSREEFMNWLRTRPEVLNIGYDPKSGKFVLREDQERWEAWQASRQGLIIELPEASEFYDPHEAEQALKACRAILTKQGLTVK